MTRDLALFALLLSTLALAPSSVVVAWMVPPPAMTTTTTTPMSSSSALFHHDNDLANNHSNEPKRIPSNRRRQVLTTSMAVLWTTVTTTTSAPLPAHAKKGPPPMSVQEAAEAVRVELQDASRGSVGRLQAALDAGDFPALMEITKTMDQSLRKQIVGQAKYYWADGNMGTQLSNNITFDLIGINRNARPGQESADGVQKYINELRNDLEQILKYTEEAAAAAAASGGEVS